MIESIHFINRVAAVTGLPYREISRRAGLNEKFAERIADGELTPSLLTMRRICDALQLELVIDCEEIIIDSPTRDADR